MLFLPQGDDTLVIKVHIVFRIFQFIPYFLSPFVEGFKKKCEEKGPCKDPPEGILPADPLCRWIVQPEECCPQDYSPNGFVCEERKSCLLTRWLIP